MDSSSSCLVLLFPHSHKPRKNTSVLVGTVLKYSAKFNVKRITERMSYVTHSRCETHPIRRDPEDIRFRESSLRVTHPCYGVNFYGLWALELTKLTVVKKCPNFKDGFKRFLRKIA